MNKETRETEYSLRTIMDILGRDIVIYLSYPNTESSSEIVCMEKAAGRSGLPASAEVPGKSKNRSVIFHTVLELGY
jgi:hypothetical protein